MEVIKIEPLSLSRQEIVTQEPFSVYLLDDYFSYKGGFMSREPGDPEETEENKDLWVDRNHYFHSVTKKEAIREIDMRYINDPPYWKIIISVEAVDPDMQLYFKKKAECLRVFEQLVRWWATLQDIPGLTQKPQI